MLRAVDKHYHLRRDMPYEGSQLQFRNSQDGIKCLVYQEDVVSKTHNGGINDRKSDRKEVWIYPHINSDRCAVKLVQKYLSLCPSYYKKTNFYLQALQKPTPKQWYSEQVIGVHTISKVVVELMKIAKIDSFFTNHSLRRSGGTRLFMAGVDPNLVKEATGHLSDAVDKYQVPGEDQRKMLSNILQGGKVKKKESETLNNKDNNVEVCELNPKIAEKSCDCKVVNESNVEEIVTQLPKKGKGKGKTVIKLEIEVHNE